MSLADAIPIAPEAIRRPSTTSLLPRQSQILLTNAPPTPPLSPNHVEPQFDQIMVDAESCSGDSHPPTLSVSSSSESMEVEDDRYLAAEPQRPLRLLEDERVHLQRFGLKLSDFEVRGTLGRSTNCQLIIAVLTQPPQRDRYFWQSFTRPTSKVEARYSKLFRHESTPQDRNCPTSPGRTC